MQKPKMILFDAGKTLLNYQNVDTLCGVRAYCAYLTANPRNLSVEEIDAQVNAIFETFEDCRKNLFEVHEQTILKLAFDLLELKFSISIPEIERIIWENASDIVPVVGAEELLSYLNTAGIRTGVISNLDFSGSLLESRLNQIYPNSQFEFVIASSDYGIRKPNPHLFQTGIQKACLSPEEIWYIGDKEKVDVRGAQCCGMTPVLYKSEFNHYASLPNDILVIDHYNQLIDHLQ